ncbi:MAG TPA: HAMP domain-containing sensor histidine kinase [Polyangiaceae bacterium]|nr:HAMP domain-containing sensor histidine kinase [Polyangiaceae bacterium]
MDYKSMGRDACGALGGDWLCDEAAAGPCGGDATDTFEVVDAYESDVGGHEAPGVRPDPVRPRPARRRAGRSRARLRLALSRARAELERRGREVEALASAAERERRLADQRAGLLGRELTARHLAEKSNRLKDELLLAVSNELRAPVSAILGWAVLLAAERRPDAAALAKGLGVIERSARAQQRMVEDLLDLARIGRGEMRLETAPVDLEGVAREALEATRPAAKAARVELQLEAPGDACPIVGDGKRLRQVLVNLLSNGVKFTPAGGRVVLSLGRRGDGVAVEVRDTGRGIHASRLPHAFDRFRPGGIDPTARAAEGGLGLGLAIVKHLVELHDGSVEAESDGEGKGSTFRVTLPAAATRPQPMAPRAVRSEPPRSAYVAP